MELKDFEEALFDGSSAGETELTAKQSAESLRAVCSVRVVDEIDVCVPFVPKCCRSSTI